VVLVIDKNAENFPALRGDLVPLFLKLFDYFFYIFHNI